MKGLFKFLAPFAPDYSGAVSVLFELGGMIVVYDAGGCTGNICGYDEPRWYGSKTALLSAGLRDMDAIFGRDDKLIDKIEDAINNIECRFIAIISTPAPSVIGTDFKALARSLHMHTGLPAFAIETNGMDMYDKGQEKAYLELFERFTSTTERGAESKTVDIGVLGATPLDMPGLFISSYISDLLRQWGYEHPACYGMGSGLEHVMSAKDALCNLVVSPSGLKAARLLKEKFGTPYVAGFPLNGTEEALRMNIEQSIRRKRGDPGNVYAYDGCKYDNDGGGESVLIIGQQVMANAVRESLRSKKSFGAIDVATWFMLDQEIAERFDVSLKEEDDLERLIQDRGYKYVVGDPLFKRAISDCERMFYVDMPHYAVSGCLYANSLPDPAADIFSHIITHSE